MGCDVGNLVPEEVLALCYYQSTLFKFQFLWELHTFKKNVKLHFLLSKQKHCNFKLSSWQFPSKMHANKLNNKGAGL